MHGVYLVCVQAYIFFTLIPIANTHMVKHWSSIDYSFKVVCVIIRIVANIYCTPSYRLISVPNWVQFLLENMCICKNLDLANKLCCSKKRSSILKQIKNIRITLTNTNNYLGFFDFVHHRLLRLRWQMTRFVLYCFQIHSYG